ncbi:hypothetical protein DF153_32620 [Burkholderia cenocepacia]|nr:hypothetical protein CFB81_22015 [Burkholderia sp. AU28863]RQU05792.1 hypothetical protein DF152_33670 [Burkholderia cenocepacia]RQU12653.1 hypothetical protein DF153_32620 [Burkholderia cenocepacia]
MRRVFRRRTRRRRALAARIAGAVSGGALSRASRGHDRLAPTAIASDCDSRFRFDFHAAATANLAGRPPASGNGFRLRPVTKNRLSRDIRIAYIAIHFDTFVACPDWRSRRVDIADPPDSNENEEDS